MIFNKLNQLRARFDPIAFWLGAIVAVVTVGEWAWRFFSGVDQMTATWIQITGVIVLAILFLFKEWEIREQRKANKMLTQKLLDIIEAGTIETARALTAGEIKDYRETHTELSRLIDRLGLASNNDEAGDRMIRMLNQMASKIGADKQ